MKTYSENFDAGETRHYFIGGRFFRIITAADGTINVRWLKNGRIIGEADGVGNYFAVDAGIAGEDFEKVEITSATMQTVKFSISNWACEVV